MTNVTPIEENLTFAGHIKNELVGVVSTALFKISTSAFFI